MGLLWVSLAWGPMPAPGQMPVPGPMPSRSGSPADDVQVFPLRQVAAREVEPLLRQVLNGLGDEWEIFLDEAGNRLAVRGPAAIRQAAQQLLDSLDQPGRVAAPAPEPPPVRFQAYPTGNEDPVHTAAVLQAQLGGQPGIRITPDPRTRQLLVVAPPEVHTWLAQRLNREVLPAVSAPPSTTAPQFAQPQGNVQPPGYSQPQENMPSGSAKFAGRVQSLNGPQGPAGTNTGEVRDPRAMPMPPTVAVPMPPQVGPGPAHMGQGQVSARQANLAGPPLPVDPNNWHGRATLAVPPAGSPPGTQAVVLLQEEPHALGPGFWAVNLKQTNWPDVEQALKTLWGDRLQKEEQTLGEWSVYTLRGNGEQAVRLLVTPRVGQIQVQGSEPLARASARVLSALDAARRPTTAQSTHVVALRNAALAKVQYVLAAYQEGAPPLPGLPNADGFAPAARQPLAPNYVARMFQQGQPGSQPTGAQPPAEVAPNQPPNQPEANPSAQELNLPPGALEALQSAGKLGPLQIELVEGLDGFILKGHPRDVERVLQLIDEIERQYIETEPQIEVHLLQHTGSEPLGALVKQLYDEILAPRQGRVNITPLVKPNALLLIGRPASVQAVKELIQRLDQPVLPAQQFEVFRLRYASAASAQTTITEFFANRNGLGTKVLISGDFRTNSLIVQASPRDLAEVSLMIKRLDTLENEAVHELRVFPLQNSLAEDLAPILQEAVLAQFGTGGQGGGGQGGLQNILTQQGGAGATGGGTGQSTLQQQQLQVKSTLLRFSAIDAQGQRKLQSGILTDMKITADPRGNALIVSAPAESMDLVGSLIRELDRIPAAEAQIKVFTVVNGDATTLVTLLQTLFPQQAGTGGQAGQGFGVQAASLISGETSLVPLRFSTDSRTNSIVASGSPNDLTVVEAILLRLDESDVRQRKTTTYRLKNSPATDVANAINQYLQSERQIQQVQPGLVSPFEQLDREVVVVPEPVSNSLIVSATPRFYDEIRQVVEELDARPPMVLVQVLIAEVALNNTDEFGVELGLQDSVLFDRSLVGAIVTTTETLTNINGTTTNNQKVISQELLPGFNFNNPNLPLGNNGVNTAGNGIVGSQGLSSFGVGRINSELGFGGLVLSAQSSSVSVLIRALKENRKLRVLSRPQIMTLDNQPAFIQVGERVPRVTGTATNQTGQTNTVTLENVGLILGVTPRISPDGLVVMELDAEKSALGAEADGIPISISAQGQIIRSPIINTTTAQTTVSALSGQTILLGGLITETKREVHRQVPLLGSVPVLKYLFRFDSVSRERTELIIILTPHVVRNERDMDRLKRQEAARINWCLSDVIRIHGEVGLRTRNDEWSDGEVQVIYPDVNPSGQVNPELLPELVPTPGAVPNPPRIQSAPSGPGPGIPPGHQPPGYRAPGLNPPGVDSSVPPFSNQRTSQFSNPPAANDTPEEGEATAEGASARRNFAGRFLPARLLSGKQSAPSTPHPTAGATLVHGTANVGPQSPAQALNGPQLNTPGPYPIPAPSMQAYPDATRPWEQVEPPLMPAGPVVRPASR